MTAACSWQATPKTEAPMRARTLPLVALILAALAWPQAAFAQATTTPAPGGGLEQAIGKVATAEGTATIEHTAAVVVQASIRGPQPAKIGDFVYKGDIVQTETDGKVGLVFLDGTALNVLPNARMTLDEFVYDPNGKWNSSLFNLVKGSFTFVGGKMAKTGGLRVNTPTATMGIRGTSSHIIIAEDGTVKFSTLVEEKK
jgi:hypothetical protein